MLISLFDPAYWALKPERGDSCQNLLGIELALRPESPTNVRRDNTNIRLRQTDYARQEATGQMRKLRRAIKRKPVAGRVRVGEHASRLHRSWGAAVDMKRHLQRVRRRREGRFDVSDLLSAHIGDIGFEFFVKQGSFGTHRCFRIEYDRQFVVTNSKVVHGS